MDRSTFTIIALSAVVAIESFFLFKPTDDPVVAKFSGETIRSSKLNAQLRERFGREVLQDMITGRLLDKAIAQAGCTVSEAELQDWVADYKKRPDAQELLASNQLDIAKLKENLRRSVPMYKLILHKIPEAERKRYFTNHASAFEEMELKGILLGSEGEAEELASRIKGEDVFSALALVHSLDIQTRDIGGNLGRVTRQELTESFDPLSVKELFVQKVGTLSSPMASNSGGWYLFWIKSRTTDYEHLRLRVMEVMATEKLSAFLENLRNQAKVEIFLPESKPFSAKDKQTESKSEATGSPKAKPLAESDTVRPKSTEEKR